MDSTIKIENFILWILISCAFFSFTIGLIMGYSLSYTQYAGILAILIATTIFFLKPAKALTTLFVILALGTLNLISFGFFIDIYFSFGVNLVGIDIASPGIQLFSLILLIVLMRKRKDKLKELYQRNFGQTNEEYQNSKESTKNRFITKFENLSDCEVVERLNHNLIPEAKEALIEIKKQRGLQ